MRGATTRLGVVVTGAVPCVLGTVAAAGDDVELGPAALLLRVRVASGVDVRGRARGKWLVTATFAGHYLNENRSMHDSP